ncbi:Anaphase-promoting complex subunit 4 [Blyttiomyces sp. JEL0837]|nr:Anaphase-promoting complex subunit 4 [Blyttiomyces sp. JEL0837]
MALKVLRARPNYNIVKCICLFPTLQHIADTPKGRVVTHLTKPGIRHAAATLILLLRLLFFFTPQLFVALVSSITKQQDKDLMTTVDKLLHPGPVLHATTLGAWEMIGVKELDVEVIEKNLDKMVFYYGATDDWAPMSHVQEMKERFPTAKVFVCEEGMPHSFVLGHSHTMAKKFIQMLESVMKVEIFDECSQPFPTVIEAKWCPGRDLLALYFANREFQVCRVNWQKVWGLHAVDITGLAWRPDGKWLAIGLADGRLHIHDVDTGVEIHSTTQPSAIHSMSWIEPSHFKRMKFKPTSFGDREMIRFLPEIAPLLDRDLESQQLGELTADLNSIWDSPFNVLASVTESQTVSFRVWGLVDIGTFTIPTDAGSSIGASKSKLAVVTKTTKLEPNDELIRLDLLDTSTLRRYQSELKRASFANIRIQSLYGSLKTVKGLYEKARDEYSDAMKRNLDLFKRISLDHGDHDYVSVFLRLVATGAAPPSMEAYLKQALGDRGLKRWKGTVTTSFSKIRRSFDVHLAPMCQHLVLELGDYLGECQTNCNYNKLGVSADLINRAISRVLSLLEEMQTLSLLIEKEIKTLEEVWTFLETNMKHDDSEESSTTITCPSPSTSLIEFVHKSFGSFGSRNVPTPFEEKLQAFHQNIDRVLEFADATFSSLRQVMKNFVKLKASTSFSRFSAGLASAGPAVPVPDHCVSLLYVKREELDWYPSLPVLKEIKRRDVESYTTTMRWKKMTQPLQRLLASTAEKIEFAFL